MPQFVLKMIFSFSLCLCNKQISIIFKCTQNKVYNTCSVVSIFLILLIHLIFMKQSLKYRIIQYQFRDKNIQVQGSKVTCLKLMSRKWQCRHVGSLAQNSNSQHCEILSLNTVFSWSLFALATTVMVLGTSLLDFKRNYFKISLLLSTFVSIFIFNIHIYISAILIYYMVRP